MGDTVEEPTTHPIVLPGIVIREEDQFNKAKEPIANYTSKGKEKVRCSNEKGKD